MFLMYYSAYIAPKLRLISLNTVQFSTHRKGVTEQDAMNQLKWLRSQLKVAKKYHENVLLTMHIPPGRDIFDHSNFWMSTEQDEFLELVKMYQNTIIGLLAGHTHHDELKIIKDSSNKNISAVFMTGSLATFYGNGPSVKTFYFSNKSGSWLLQNDRTFNFLDKLMLALHKYYEYNKVYCDNKKDDLYQCLGNVTVNKIEKYYQLGNPNLSSPAIQLNDIEITLA